MYNNTDFLVTHSAIQQPDLVRAKGSAIYRDTTRFSLSLFVLMAIFPVNLG